LVQSLELPRMGPTAWRSFRSFLKTKMNCWRAMPTRVRQGPYADVKGLKERMHHEKLLTWIEDPKLAPSRRRLYLTMLGICGQPADADRLESISRATIAR